MRYSIAIVISLIVSSLSPAEEKPQPNTLSEKEISAGWLLLFDGETSVGWKAQTSGRDRQADLAVKNGALILASRGPAGSLRTDGTPAVLSLDCTTGWPAFEMTAEYRAPVKGARFALSVSCDGKTTTHGHELEMASGESWQAITVRWSKQSFQMHIGGREIPNSSGRPAGKLAMARPGFSVPDSTDAQLELRYLKLRPLDLEPLFNGKDLEGWAINQSDPKRVASRWTVTQNGELSLKTGPGDLVSVREFDDFVLQVQCKTLGRGLNSGVFFRCIPGQYQNGYEAQIHNLFLADRSKPLDFGTGAIYRRVPARKVVSNDNEWFVMTVAASGNHISTWVNGYQTVDWVDTRAPDDNPRKGYRSARGPISLQGHDPTTDLLFRSIQIAELPSQKE